jgi:hypothetical protein
VTYLVKDIRDQLAGSIPILNAFSDRMYPEVIPQGGEYPCIVINEISAAPEYYLAGEVGKHYTQIQIDVWTDGTGGKSKLNELSELVRNRLNGYRGTFGSGVSGTARMTRNDPISVAPVDGSDLHRRRQSMDFEIFHSADVPTFA